MFDSDEPKFKEPEKIIELLNEEKSINKMIRLYIYKILFNKSFASPLKLLSIPSKIVFPLNL